MESSSASCCTEASLENNNKHPNGLDNGRRHSLEAIGDKDVGGDSGSPPSSPAIEELEDWRATLHRLCSDSSTWHEWNTSSVYAGIPDDVAGRIDVRARPVSIQELEQELLDYEHMLDQARSEAEEVAQSAADLTSLDQLCADISDLVTELKPKQESLRQEVAFLTQVDALSQDAEALKVSGDSVKRVDELMRGLKLSKEIGSEVADVKNA